MNVERIRMAALQHKVMSAKQAAELVKPGMTLGLSGFTRAGDAKAVPDALIERAKKNPLQVTVITGASLGHDTDKRMAEAGLLARRLPFQVDTALRRAINQGEVPFLDQHLSETTAQLRHGHLKPIDVAVIEAVAIQEDGSIVPTMSVGNSVIFAEQAKQIIIELNQAVPVALEGLHDIYTLAAEQGRQPLPLTRVDQRIGTTAIKVDPARIAAIVLTQEIDSPSNALPPDTDTQAIARHIGWFFEQEVEAGRMGPSLRPLQAGIGTIANAVLHGLLDSPFEDLTMYSEVLQDSAFELIDAGKVRFASASSITVSGTVYHRFLSQLGRYRDKVVLRPQDISNAAELIRRLGVIAINTALEVDIYGNVNSTHVGGTHMMNGIGGSGDFARNASLAMFVTKSIAKDGDISSIVPMVPHVDHGMQDVDVVVTECGLADLRGKSPRERALSIIENCVHADYRDALLDYFHRACLRGGQTPHLLEEAFGWHQRFQQTGSMRVQRETALAL
ncbi:MAG: succinate CoA transferase [Pigmentiphaga sp.]